MAAFIFVSGCQETLGPFLVIWSLLTLRMCCCLDPVVLDIIWATQWCLRVPRPPLWLYTLKRAALVGGGFREPPFLQGNKDLKVIPGSGSSSTLDRAPQLWTWEFPIDLDTANEGKKPLPLPWTMLPQPNSSCVPRLRAFCCCVVCCGVVAFWLPVGGARQVEPKNFPTISGSEPEEMDLLD